MENAFISLKKALMPPPVLLFPDFDKPFALGTDVFVVAMEVDPPSVFCMWGFERARAEVLRLNAGHWRIFLLLKFTFSLFLHRAFHVLF